MQKENIKCSLKKHSDINAVIFCIECKRYLCNKCKSNHLELFEDHQFHNLDQNIKDLFTGYCNENKGNKMEFYPIF